MAVDSNINLTIVFNDPELDTEQQEEELKNLLEQMKKWDEVEAVSHVPDPDLPDRSKAFGGFLVGMLTAVVKPENIKALLSSLSNQLLGKTIEMEVEANGRKLKVKASNREELAAAIQEAQKFIST